MSNLIKIAVDAMGGDGSPKKIIDGIVLNHQFNKKNFFKIFGDKNKINELIKDKISSPLCCFQSYISCKTIRNNNVYFSIH